MKIEINQTQTERLLDFVMDELESIKDEEKNQAIAPDMAEVNELLDLAGLLGETVTWADFEAAPADEPGSDTD